MSDPDLGSLQRWFQAVITNPDGVEARAEFEGLVCEQLVRPGVRLTERESVAIYHRMYFARLVEVLEVEFPALRALLGAEEFRRTARDYLAMHPPSDPNLDRLGRDLPVHLSRTDAGFPADLALVERAIHEVFDAPAAEPLTAEDLAALPEADGPRSSLRLIPAHRCLELTHPVHRWYRDFREGRIEATPAPRPSWMLVYRKGFEVWRRPLEASGFVILRALGEGCRLGEALERAVGELDLDPERLEGELPDLFATWAAEGLFRGVDRP